MAKLPRSRITSSITSPAAEPRTARYVFNEVEGRPWVDVRQASLCLDYIAALTEKDPKVVRKFFNGTLKKSKHHNDFRRYDRELYPLHLITAGGGIINNDGEPVPFCFEACREFVGKLPANSFDALRAFAFDDRNFGASFDR